MYRLLLAVAVLRCLAAQSNLPAFEVAEVKTNRSVRGNTEGSHRPQAGGRIEARNVPLKAFILGAFNLQEHLLAGGPEWLETERFDIIAKAAPDTPDATIRLMCQRLLAERFKLAVHREERIMPVYALVAAKGGAKPKPSPGQGQSQCSSSFGDGAISRECLHTTMAELVSQLAVMGRTALDVPLVDATELPGAYDFKLTWSLPDRTILVGLSGAGLKLESRKQAVQVVVIDHVERVPTDN